MSTSQRQEQRLSAGSGSEGAAEQSAASTSPSQHPRRPSLPFRSSSRRPSNGAWADSSVRPIISPEAVRSQALDLEDHNEAVQEQRLDEGKALAKMPSVRVRRRGSVASPAANGFRDRRSSSIGAADSSRHEGTDRTRRGSVKVQTAVAEKGAANSSSSDQTTDLEMHPLTAQSSDTPVLPTPLSEVDEEKSLLAKIPAAEEPESEAERARKAELRAKADAVLDRETAAAGHHTPFPHLHRHSQKPATQEPTPSVEKQARTAHALPHLHVHGGHHSTRHHLRGEVRAEPYKFKPLELLAQRKREKARQKEAERGQQRMQRWVNVGSESNTPVNELEPPVTAPPPVRIRSEDSDDELDDSGDGPALAPEAATADEEQQAWAIVDHLDVVDPTVSTVGHLANIGNSIVIPYIPTLYNRRPVIDLPPAAEAELEGSSDSNGKGAESGVGDSNSPAAAPLTKKQKLLGFLKGLGQYLCTWQGALVGVYGFLVVFWGAGLVLILLNWININPKSQKDLWVEIASQILNGLFTITGVGLIPWRVRDFYWLCLLTHYTRTTWRLRREQGLAPLKDKNALPRAPGRPELTTSASAGSLSTIESATQAIGTYEVEEEQVLSERQAARLHRIQAKFGASATWYRPVETATHYAFSIHWALAITILQIGNSAFQVCLCIAMWGYAHDYTNRPAWMTATGIVLSFLCGIFAGVLIWRGGERTKKHEEVKDQLYGTKS